MIRRVVVAIVMILMVCGSGLLASSQRSGSASVARASAPAGHSSQAHQSSGPTRSPAVLVDATRAAVSSLKDVCRLTRVTGPLHVSTIGVGSDALADCGDRSSPHYLRTFVLLI